MKFNRILAAALPVISLAASAQSSITLFGIVDVNARYVRNSDLPGNLTMNNSGLASGRLGFRGDEDLGGGLRAGFWLESDVNADTGTFSSTGKFFQRRSTVSLSGGFGEVRLGRDDSATFLSTLIFDPFLTNGVGGTMGFTMLGIPGTGTATGGAPIQISNAVSYFLPQNLGGFYGQVQVAMGEQARSAPNKNQGDYRGLRFGYRQGPFNGALATGKFYGDSDATNLTASNVGLSWDFGVAKPMLLWASEKRGALKVTALQLGVTAPVGMGEFKASYGHYNTDGSNADWNKISVGYGHNLSKRTQVYGTVAFLKNKDGAAKSIGVQGLSAPGTTLGGRSSGFEVGVRHFF
ncbi:porin [Delftia tsuruhatensis]|uniref:porin n=1 Tax=Delftia tsuruhatensis TaxID=180282 RepID=UPI000619AA1B|nr:porin [Delftia tsuruhatensis]